MTTPLVFAYPGDLETPTGGYAYDRRLIKELRALGRDVSLLPLGPGFPFPSAATKISASEALAAVPDGTTLLVDGLALGVLDDWALSEAHRLRLIALVHHPLALEGSMSPDIETSLRASETRALSVAAHVIVTSPQTARDLTNSYAVPADRITVALPGTDPARQAQAELHPPMILSVGSLIPRKGHDALITALAALEHLDWQLKIVGSKTLSPSTASELQAQIDNLGLAGRIELTGAVDDTRAAMANAQLFALASRFEGYGMVFAEAMSQGLPIVACHTGAVPEVVPPQAGILVAPDDPSALAAALEPLIRDPERRSRLAAGSAATGAALPKWADTAALLDQLIFQRPPA